MEQRELAILIAAVSGALTLGSVVLAIPCRQKRLQWLHHLPALLIAITFAVGMIAIIGWDLRLLGPNVGYLAWLFWAAAACAVVTIIGAIPKLKRIVMLVVAAVLLAGVMYEMGQGRLESTRGWSAADGAFWITLSASIGLANSVAGAWVESKAGARPVFIAWMIAITLGAGVVGLLGKSERLANIMLVLGGATAGATLGSLIWNRFRPGTSMWITLSTLSVGLISAAMEPWYSSLPVPQAVLLLCAPLACVMALVADRSRAWKPVLVVMVLTLSLLVWPLIESYETYQAYRALGFAP